MTEPTGRRPIASRKRSAIIERERRCWELAARGWTVNRIAEYLELEPSTVGKTLRRLRARYWTQLQADVEARSADQMAKLEHILAESLDAWERSKQPTSSVRRKSRQVQQEGQSSDVPMETTVTSEQRVGDPRFLVVAVNAMRDMRALMTTGPGDAPNAATLPLRALTPQERLFVASFLRAAASGEELPAGGLEGAIDVTPGTGPPALPEGGTEEGTGGDV